jgi:hypothetical protein
MTDSPDPVSPFPHRQRPQPISLHLQQHIARCNSSPSSPSPSPSPASWPPLSRNTPRASASARAARSRRAASCSAPAPWISLSALRLIRYTFPLPLPPHLRSSPPISSSLRSLATSLDTTICLDNEVNKCCPWDAAVSPNLKYIFPWRSSPRFAQILTRPGCIVQTKKLLSKGTCTDIIIN